MKILMSLLKSAVRFDQASRENADFCQIDFYGQF